MALAPSSIKRLARNDLGMNTCTSISRIITLKHMTLKNYAPNELFNYQQIKLDEGTRKKLSDVDFVYLEDLGIN